jgi:FSR family fosmidomycin resistance protein-like MFS transporter
MPDTGEANQQPAADTNPSPTGDGARFSSARILTISVGHAVHDAYSAFLPPLLPYLISRFSLSITRAGLLGLFLQAPSILQPAIGNLADRRSLRWAVVVAPAVTGTLMSLLGIAPSYGTLAALLLVTGLSSACLHAVGPVMAGRLSGQRLGRGMSLWMVGGELGRTIGPLALVTAIASLDMSHIYWLAIAGWATSIVLLLLSRGMPSSSSPADTRLPWQPALRGMRALLLPLAGVITTRAFMNAALSTFLPTFMREEGSSLWVAGAALSILEGAGVLGALLGGSLSDRLGRRFILGITMVGPAVLMVLFLSVSDAPRLAVLPFLGLTTFAATPVMLAIVQETHTQNRALANGLYMLLSFVIRAIVVVLVGALGDWVGLRNAFLCSAALMLLGTPLVFLIPIKKARPAQDGDPVPH